MLLWCLLETGPQKHRAKFLERSPYLGWFCSTIPSAVMATVKTGGDARWTFVNQGILTRPYLSSLIYLTRKGLDQRGSQCYFQALQRCSRSHPTQWQTERNWRRVFITESRHNISNTFTAEINAILKEDYDYYRCTQSVPRRIDRDDLAGAGFANVTGCHILPKSFILY